MAFFNKILRKLDSFERIRVSMLSRWPLTDACTVIAFTSQSSGSGVSTVVAGLSRVFASDSSGRILVIEVAPGKETIASKISREKPVENEKPPGFFTSDNEHGIDIITLSNSASHTGNSSQIKSILDDFRNNYSVILIDAGALSHSGGTYWLTNSDYRVLVIDSNVTTREMLENQARELSQSCIELDGSILNKRAYPIPSSLYWLTR